MNTYVTIGHVPLPFYFLILFPDVKLIPPSPLSPTKVRVNERIDCVTLAFRL